MNFRRETLKECEETDTMMWFLYPSVLCKMSVQSHHCWLVKEWTIPEVWRGDYTQAFLGCTAHVLRLLFCLASSELTCTVLRLGWRYGMGRMVKKTLRATEYDVINAELEVRGPKL